MSHHQKGKGNNIQLQNGGSISWGETHRCEKCKNAEGDEVKSEHDNDDVVAYLCSDCYQKWIAIFHKKYLHLINRPELDEKFKKWLNAKVFVFR